MKLGFRQASEGDCEFLWLCRKDHDTVGSTISQRIPTPRSHNQWMRDALDPHKPNKVYVVTEHDRHYGYRVGTLTVQELPDHLTLSWTVAPDARNRGIGKEMVKLFAATLRRPVVAHIRPENLYSHNIALYAGFRETGDKDEHGLDLYEIPAAHDDA